MIVILILDIELSRPKERQYFEGDLGADGGVMSDLVSRVLCIMTSDFNDLCERQL